MSVGRGIQSVIFYYLSCTPCTKVSNRRNRKRQSEKDKAEREAVALQNPDTYRQPSPFRTNVYWAEEIQVGPGPPLRRLPKKERKRRQLEKDGRGRSPTRKQIQNTTPEKKDVLAVPEPAYLGGLKGIIKNNQNRLSGLESKWKDWRRFQREDEELWGDNESMEDLAPRVMDSRQGPVRNSVGGSSIGVPGLLQLDMHGKSNERREGYWMARHPPVNDLHPPVVSVPNRSKPANQWMLQPPPPSAVMNGYKHSSRYRSDSENNGRKDRATKVKTNNEIDNVEGEIIQNNAIAEPSTQHQDAPPTDSPVLDGATDDRRHPEHGDSGIDVSGSSDQSTTSRDATIRQDFAYTIKPHIPTQPFTNTKTTTKPKLQPPAPSHLPTSSRNSSTRSKKASRVAMPIRSSPLESKRTETRHTSRPGLPRVLSNPTSTTTINYISLQRAQFDGVFAVVNTKSHGNPRLSNDLVDVDADAEREEEDEREDEEEEQVDPLDSRPPRRRRGHTESQASARRRRHNKDFLHARQWPDDPRGGNDEESRAFQEEENDDENDDDAEHEAEEEDRFGYGIPWPQKQKQQQHQQQQKQQQQQRNYFTLPIGPNIGGRRWSFDL